MKTVTVTFLFVMALLLVPGTAHAQWDCSGVTCPGCDWQDGCNQCHMGGSVFSNSAGCFCDGNCGCATEGYDGGPCIPMSSEKPRSSTPNASKPTVVRIESLILSYLSGVPQYRRMIHAYTAGTEAANLALTIGGKLQPGVKMDADGLLLPKNHLYDFRTGKMSVKK